MRVPPRTPGIIPATNSCTTELSDITAYKIMGIEGGMIMAMVAEEDVTAAANPLGYPLRFMAGMRIDPRAATSATAEPDISAKNMEAATLTMARPPLIKPNNAEAKAINRREMPEVFMMAPAKMNKGIASNGKLVAPSNMTRATLGKMSTPWVTIMATTATTARATAIGTLMAISTIKPKSIQKRVMGGAPPQLQYLI